LTAAYELLDRTDIKPVVYEMTDDVGGISRTVDYKGNKIDIGGHRFFSKSDRVMRWWTNIMPVQGAPTGENPAYVREIDLPPYAEQRGIGEKEARRVPSPDPETTDEVMLIRRRLSRILFKGRLFDYPISLDIRTLRKLGISQTVKVGLSYIKARLFPIREEKSLEDFFINRFGRELYKIFFKDYTEKVWGVPCSEISPEWGAQRVKGLSISKAVWQALKKALGRDPTSYEQKEVETSLIERFLYPKFGPGQLWKKVARLIEEKGGEIHLGHRVTAIKCAEGVVEEITVRDEATRRETAVKGDYFFSSMPIKDLVAALGEGVPPDVSRTAQELEYRDFITVGLLLKNLRLEREAGGEPGEGGILDNWIYVQERSMLSSRLQIFNNWSPYLVKDRDKVWVGLEYICSESDDLWSASDEQLLRSAVDELVSMKAVNEEDVLDGLVIRMPKAYPSYTGSYKRLPLIREFTDGLENLFLIGRNGMHRYNNQDHSMLSAMVAVDNIISGVTSKDNIWSINVEEEYLEEK